MATNNGNPTLAEPLMSTQNYGNSNNRTGYSFTRFSQFLGVSRGLGRGANCCTVDKIIYDIFNVFIFCGNNAITS